MSADEQIVRLDVLTDVIQRALFRWPDHRSRIEGATVLLAFGLVERNREGGYAVGSRSQPGVRYAVGRNSCACEGRRRRPDLACAHMMAVRLLEIARGRQRVLDQRAQFGPMQLVKLREMRERYRRGEVAV